MAEHKLSKKKRIAITVVSVSLAIAVLCGAVTYIGLDMSYKINYAARYTEAQHLERVSARVEKYFMTEDSGYTGYTVYPLYNENDKLSYFLVEFEPVGFVYIKLNEYHSQILQNMGLRSMYCYDWSYSVDQTWSRYRISDHEVMKYNDGTWEDSDPYPEQGWKYDENKDGYSDNCFRRWETNAIGDFVCHKESPFKLLNITDEKRYLIMIKGNDFGYMPTVIRDGNWYNLISLEMFSQSEYPIIYDNEVVCGYIDSKKIPYETSIDFPIKAYTNLQ